MECVDSPISSHDKDVLAYSFIAKETGSHSRSNFPKVSWYFPGKFQNGSLNYRTNQVGGSGKWFLTPSDQKRNKHEGNHGMLLLCRGTGPAESLPGSQGLGV